ncbi:TIGR01777 family oxidoreductase [Haemophilus haemoglobinophilus]|nr:TIGR01777 family oxidoreductase [Canicola haemoglobinophilus]
MKVFITGATGLIGSHLIPLLLEQKYQITALVRNLEQARQQLPNQVKLVQDLSDYVHFNEFDIIINLAGAPIFAQSWTAEYKTTLLESRIKLTEKLTALINNSEMPPHCFISASATGYYGDQQDKLITETSSCGNQFTAQLCEQWENTALKANTRVCLLRTGIVFSHQGGALEKILPVYRYGFGGKLGDGKQFWAWISLQDMLQSILFLLANSQCQGAFNLVAPAPIQNQDFNQQLGAWLKRPYFATVPKFLLRLVLGERASLLLDSQKAIPQKLLNAGFQFSTPTFSDFLTSIKNSSK